MFILSSHYAQNQTKNDAVSEQANISVKTDSNAVKGISVKNIDSVMAKNKHKPIYKVDKNYRQLKSDSYYDVAIYVIKKQFQDSPIISWFFTIMLVSWIISMIKRLIDKLSHK